MADAGTFEELKVPTTTAELIWLCSRASRAGVLNAVRGALAAGVPIINESCTDSALHAALASGQHKVVRDKKAWVYAGLFALSPLPHTCTRPLPTYTPAPLSLPDYQGAPGSLPQGAHQHGWGMWDCVQP